MVDVVEIVDIVRENLLKSFRKAGLEMDESSIDTIVDVIQEEVEVTIGL